MHFKIFLVIASLLIASVVLYVKMDEDSLPPSTLPSSPVNSKSVSKNEAHITSSSKEEEVASNLPNEKLSIGNVAGTSTDKIYADLNYVWAEKEKLGHLGTSHLENYKDYDDETLVALMKMDDVIAAYQYVENSDDLKDGCKRSAIAIKHGLTSNAINFLVGCSNTDIYNASRIGPEFVEDVKIRSMAFIEFATYRGDFSHMVRNLHKDVELSPETIAQVSDLAQLIFDDVNKYRIAQGLEPYQKRNRGRMLTEELQFLRNTGTLDGMDDWKRSLLGLPPQVQSGSGHG